MKLSSTHIKFYILLFLVFANGFVWYYIANEYPTDTLSVSFFDVGQGDAIFVETPSHKQILIDGGYPNGKVLRELGKYMPIYDRSIDLVIATHPDADHIGGLVDVLERFVVSQVIDSGYVSDGVAFTQKEKLIEENSIERIHGLQNTRIDFGDGVSLAILFPAETITEGATNNAAVVIRVSYGEHDFLLTADAPQSIERYLVSYFGDDLESEVMKVGHHGSKTSTAPEFLAKVAPSYAVISSGSDNTYGHPHKSVLERLSDFDITTLRTDKLGTITFETNGRDLKIK